MIIISIRNSRFFRIYSPLLVFYLILSRIVALFISLLKTLIKVVINQIFDKYNENNKCKKGREVDVQENNQAQLNKIFFSGAKIAFIKPKQAFIIIFILCNFEIKCYI